MKSFAWFAVALTFVSARPVKAEPVLAPPARSASLTVVTDGLDDCPRPAALERAVERRLRRTVFGQAQPELLFRIGYQRSAEPPGYVARIELHDALGRSRGERVLALPAARCRELEPPVVLVLALLLESPPEPVPEQPREAPAVVAAPPRPAPPVVPERRPASAPWRYEASVGAVGGSVLGPFGFGARAGFGFAPPWAWLFRVEASRLFNTRTELAASAAGAELAAIGFGVFACPLRRWAALGAWACLGGRGDWVSGQGVGLEGARSATILQLSGEARFGGSLALFGPVSARAAAGFIAAGRRPELRYRTPAGERGQLHRAPVVAAELEIGLAVEAPGP